MSSKSAPDAAPAAKRPWSLAARLTAWYAGSAFALVLAATGFLYWALVTTLDREDDEELADKVRILRAILRDRPADLTAIRQQAEWGWAARQHGQVHVRLLDDHGQIVLETPGMSRVLPAELFPAPVRADAEPTQGAANIRSRDDKPFRILAARAAADAAAPSAHSIQVGLDRTAEEELCRNYRQSLWLVLSLALVLCTLGGYRIARRGLQPVQEVTAMARRIRPTTLGERLPVAGLPAELLALADTFNAMLDRLEESFGRLAQFSGDIAHELRTPVNNLRGEAEVALGRPRSVQEYRDVLGSCLEECGRLSRTIDNLLFLARAEDPRAQVEREPVDVGKELAAVREFYEAAAAEAGITLTVEARGEAALNRPMLQRAVGNLVENALAHTGPGGAVTLTATQDGEGVRIEVADTGCGIDAADLPRVFDRFYRADRARSSAAGNVGLGLAIVKSIAELHGGSVEIVSQARRGTRVTLRFPRRKIPQAAAAAGPADGQPR